MFICQNAEEVHAHLCECWRGTRRIVRSLEIFSRTFFSL